MQVWCVQSCHKGLFGTTSSTSTGFPPNFTQIHILFHLLSGKDLIHLKKIKAPNTHRVRLINGSRGESGGADFGLCGAEDFLSLLTEE